MILTTVSPIFAVDAKNTTTKQNVTEVELSSEKTKDGKLKFNLGEAIKKIEKQELELKKAETTEDGLDLSDEIVNPRVQNGGTFDWTLFPNNNFDATFLWYNLADANDTNGTIIQALTFSENHTTDKLEVKTKEVNGFEDIDLDVKISDIDKYQVRAYLNLDGTTQQSEGKYNLVFKVYEIVSPKINVEWLDDKGVELNAAPSEVGQIAKLEGIGSTPITFIPKKG